MNDMLSPDEKDVFDILMDLQQESNRDAWLENMKQVHGSQSGAVRDIEADMRKRKLIKETGGMLTKEHPKARINIDVKKIISLRIMGIGYREIAKEMQCSVGYAHNTVANFRKYLY